MLGFHCQLQEVPDQLYKLETKALRRFNTGPGNWFQNADLYNLTANFGFPISYPSIRAVSLAAKLRVFEFEAPQAQQQAARLLDEWLDATSRPFPYEWCNSSHVCVLDRAVKDASNIGVTSGTIREALVVKAQAKAVDEQEYVKKNFQREAYAQIVKRGMDHQNAHNRFRAKMKRWPSGLVPRVQAERAQKVLARLGRLVRPRVLAAVWRSMWNGWCTRRRFQQDGLCLFGCSSTARDCIEHYAFCPRYTRFRQATLHLPKIESLDHFLLLQHPNWSDNRLILESIGIFALYTVFNMARVATDRASWTEAVYVEAMERSAYHAVQNHKSSAAALSLVGRPFGEQAAGQQRRRATSAPARPRSQNMGASGC